MKALTKAEEYVKAAGFDRPVVKLVGEDGNAFSVMGRTKKVLSRSVSLEAAEEYVELAMSCGSYDELLAVTMEFVEVE